MAELEKNTKYLLLFTFLLLLAGIGFVVRGFLLPLVGQVTVFYQSPQIEINEESLTSPVLAGLTQFYHIGYPDEEIGRRDLFNKPDRTLTEDDS